MQKRLCTFLLVLFCLQLTAQDTVHDNGYNVFHYPNGKVSSEGFMRDGQPDGYWKTYYENGILKSEGNRKEFLLDSVWKFYSDSGSLVLQIAYQNGMKNGIRKTVQKNFVLEEQFADDVKQGWTKWYYNSGELKKKVFFQDGREEGNAREYAKDGTVITLIDYKKGYIIHSENINRTRNGLKHGVWKEFYPDERLREEGVYSYGKKNGYFKEFDQGGNLLNIRKYANDVEIFDAPELASYEIRTDYYKNGKPRIVASYKDGVPEGVRREYNAEGEISQSYVFKSGIIVGEGIIDASGKRQGPWKEFYESGELYSEGNYVDGKRTGPWKFYFREGSLEQTGSYNSAGNPEGPWKWYYESGHLKKEERMKNGLPDGEMKELSDSGKVIIQGQYVEGEEEGEWFYEVNDDKVIGSYQFGKREGLWKNYTNGKLYFEGSYIEGLADGEHSWYYDNGRLREKGLYIAGKKEGLWVLYNYEGEKILSQEFVDGIEVSLDGKKLDPDPQK